MMELETFHYLKGKSWWPKVLWSSDIAVTSQMRGLSSSGKFPLFVGKNSTSEDSLREEDQNIIFAAAALGVLLGRINYVYTYGVVKLPVSTSSLIVASQLVFTADAAFVLVKQRFMVNAVVLLTIGAEVLVVGSSGDRPAGESKKEYVAEFLMALAAASNDLTL
ncbi:purine permease 1-like [Ipomoea triloba]|uniref:purine permease 1-like n=1 Tax=Ipomoea triloba TaxID=35885 RepID=UPI00125D69A6|nr:purine permease 1-like [Ipomoea triloba]